MDSATLAAQIADYDKKKINSVDALNEAMGQFGIPEIRNRVKGLRTTIANTESSLNAVDPSVTGRTSQSLVTEAQRQRMVANERQPIAEQLSGQNKALGDETVNLNENTQQATQLASNRINDYQTGRQALQSQYDAAFQREQAAAAEAAKARDFAESQRQFNEQQATARNAASYTGGSGGSAKAGSAESKATLSAQIAKNVQSMAGKDGYVSRATFASALRDFQVAGLGDIRKFWQIYGQYTNPKTRNQYANYAQR